MNKIWRALAVLALLGAVAACGGGDSIDGCQKRLTNETYANIADPDRKVESDIGVYTECDGLTDAQQIEARDRVAAKLFGDLLGGDNS